MKIVIDINKQIITDLKNGYARLSEIADAVKNGTVLPSGHGRLTDLDEIIKFTYATYGIGSGKSITEDNKDFIEYIYNDAPVLVEADKETENENCN